MTRYLPESENFLGLPEAYSDPKLAGVVVVSAPFEATSSYGRGSRQGPAAIIEASRQVELYDARLSTEAYRSTRGVATAAPLELDGLDGGAVAQKLQAAVAEQLEAGKWVVTLGGEHSSIVGAVAAHHARFPEMSVLQLDAHSDLRESYENTQWSHASAMARVAEFNTRIVQVGIRSQAAEERDRSRALGLPVFYGEALQEWDAAGEDWISRVVAATGPQVYVTFDCDALDPSIMPSTGTPEPAGLSWRQVNRLFSRLCKERTIVGLDVNELAPIKGLSHPEFTMAKLIYRIIGYRATSTLTTPPTA
jgi:agmatinase